MYGNVDTDLLWLILIAKYLIKEYNATRTKANYRIFYKKDNDGKLELVISFHIYDVFMSVRPETLENIKETIKLKFNIQEPEK